MFAVVDDQAASALEDALVRSNHLATLINTTCESSPLFEDARPCASQGLCALSLQHGAGVRSLLVTLPASAIALMRPQYECLVRAVWAAHAADDSDLARLLAPLTPESQQAAKKLPGVPEMLAKLESSGPRGAAALLGRARSRLGDGLNSFVHGGIHPFARYQAGYPVSLLLDVLKSSNGLAMLTLNVLAALPQQHTGLLFVQKLHASFEDVLPRLEPL
jgi:hypothetical protein